MNSMRQWMVIAGSVALALILSAAEALASDRWLHVRVNSKDGGGENVSVNIPIQMIEALLPMIESDDVRGGRVSLHDADLHGIDLPKMLAALNDAPDGQFVTVQSDDEQIEVAKERGFLKVHVDERNGGERVRVTIPMTVVQALVGAGENELDVLAAIRTLADYDGGDIVSVDSDDETVRIWIDSSQTGN